MKVTIDEGVETRVIETGVIDNPLLELPEWNKTIAVKLAETEGVDLTDTHWDVIHFLRSHYQRCGPCPSGRELQGLIEEQFARQGGRKYLYQLFPRGPVVQASKIAGLPLPPYSKDLAFGSVM